MLLPMGVTAIATETAIAQRYSAWKDSQDQSSNQTAAQPLCRPSPLRHSSSATYRFADLYREPASE